MYVLNRNTSTASYERTIICYCDSCFLSTTGSDVWTWCNTWKIWYIYIFLFKYLNQSLKFYFSSWQNKIPITFCYQIVCWFFFEGNQLCCVWKLFWIVWILKYRSWDRSSKGYVWYHQWDWCWTSEIANPKTIKGSIHCIEQGFDVVWVRELIVNARI